MKSLKDLVSKECYQEIVRSSKESFGAAFYTMFPAVEHVLIYGDVKAKRAILDLLQIDTCRVCDHCGKLMSAGYLDEEHLEYACCKECLQKVKNWSDEELQEWYNNWSDEDFIYWTEWE